MKSELNARQWAVYNLLKNNPDRYFTQLDIVLKLQELFTLDFTADTFHDSKARHTLTKDIRAINQSDIIQKIVISNNQGVKIANSAEFEKYIKEKGYSFFRISAVTGEGVRELIAETAARLQELPDTIVFEADYVAEQPVEKKGHDFTVQKVEGIYTVEGEFIRKIMAGINFADGESIAYFEMILRNNGVMEQLEELGIQEGDTVQIYEFSFEYVR